MDKAYRAAGSPIGIRAIDPLAYYDIEDPEAPTGLGQVVIYERKPYRPIYAQLQRDLSPEEFQKIQLPRPGDPGAPHAQTGTDEMRTGYCETIRYYDNYWYAWVVNGQLVDCHYHGFPGIPIFTQKGMTTSSPNRSEQLQGITWGMSALETTLNDLMTLAVDVAYTYTPPRWVVETDVEGTIARTKDGCIKWVG